MTDGPDWAETLNAVKKVPGKGRTKNDRLGMDQVAQWQEFQQQRTGADVAVALGGVDTGDDYDGWGHVTNWAGDVLSGFQNIWNGWFGSGGTGTPAQTQYVIESIKDAVINGYTVHTVTSDEVNWVVPSHTEFVAILIGGGQNGAAGYGSGTHVTGGLGGLGGSYIAQQLDLTGIAALDIQVGTAGNKSYVRVANVGSPHTGTVVLASPDAGTTGGIASSFGYTSTSSTPGNGGNGEGIGSGHTASTAGTPSAAAVGGAAGTPGFFGNPGGNGGNVSAATTTKCGGGGGGGGGSATGNFQAGGSGGAGGYPGGGGGGGGCGSVAAAGSAGPGAAGVIWLFYR